MFLIGFVVFKSILSKKYKIVKLWGMIIEEDYVISYFSDLGDFKIKVDFDNVILLLLLGCY